MKKKKPARKIFELPYPFLKTNNKRDKIKPSKLIKRKIASI